MGKYIDASAIKAKIMRMSLDFSGSDIEEPYKRGVIRGMTDVQVMLETAQAADVAPVRHEHWIPVKFADSQWLINDGVLCLTDGFLCGSCGYEAIEKFPYCPRCGARMDTD